MIANLTSQLNILPFSYNQGFRGIIAFCESIRKSKKNSHSRKVFMIFITFKFSFVMLRVHFSKRWEVNAPFYRMFFFCPNNEWLFAWLLHALIHDIMRTSHDVIHQTCLVANKHCITWFFLSSFHMPWSHGVTFLGKAAPLMIVIVMLFFQILLTVHKSIVRPPWKKSLRWRQLWWTAERLCFAKEERDSRDREGDLN